MSSSRSVCRSSRRILALAAVTTVAGAEVLDTDGTFWPRMRLWPSVASLASEDRRVPRTAVVFGEDPVMQSSSSFQTSSSSSFSSVNGKDGKRTSHSEQVADSAVRDAKGNVDHKRKAKVCINGKCEDGSVEDDKMPELPRIAMPDMMSGFGNSFARAFRPFGGFGGAFDGGFDEGIGRSIDRDVQQMDQQMQDGPFSDVDKMSQSMDKSMDKMDDKVTQEENKKMMHGMMGAMQDPFRIMSGMMGNDAMSPNAAAAGSGSTQLRGSQAGGVVDGHSQGMTSSFSYSNMNGKEHAKKTRTVCKDGICHTETAEE